MSCSIGYVGQVVVGTHAYLCSGIDHDVGVVVLVELEVVDVVVADGEVGGVVSVEANVF